MKSSKLLDILAAGALGDAFGYAVEFDSWATIQSRFGLFGLVQWPFDPASGKLVASDDTQMTIFALEGLSRAVAEHGRAMDAKQAGHECFQAFLRWLDTQESPRPMAGGVAAMEALWQRQAPGATCLSALSAARRGQPVANDSKGCGAAMRAAPCAALAGVWGAELAWDAADLQGLSTHSHLDGHLSGAALAWMVAAEPADAGALAAAAREAADRALARGGAGTAERIRKALALAERELAPEELCDELGEGWTGDEAVGVALWAALRSKSVAEAIRLGANHRGDSDSAASMAAQLAACLWGLSAQERIAFSRVDLAPALLFVHAQWAEALEKASSAP